MDKTMEKQMSERNIQALFDQLRNMPMTTYFGTVKYLWNETERRFKEVRHQEAGTYCHG